MSKVFLDVGHGGKDPRTLGDGLQEIKQLRSLKETNRKDKKHSNQDRKKYF